MTSRERMMTAMRRGTPDRVPVAARMGKFMRKYYAHVPDMLTRLLMAHEEFGNDIFAYGPCAPLPCFAPVGTPWRDDVEVEIRHEVRDGMNWWERTIHTPAGDLHDIKRALIIETGSGSGPEIVEPLVKDFSRDLPRIVYMMPDPKKTIDLAQYARMDEAIAERGIVVGTTYGCIDCRDVLTQADFLVLAHDDPGAFQEIVRIGGEAMMAETRYLLEAGRRVIKCWWFYTSPSAGWSPSIYEKMFLPWVHKHVALVHDYGGIYIYYDDGKMGRFIDFYVDAGIDVLMTLTPPPMGDADPRTIKEKYGHRVCLMGGFDAVNEIWLGTPEKIRRTVEQRLSIYKPGGGYIMDGSNIIPYETPVENVRAFIQAGRDFGQY